MNDNIANSISKVLGYSLFPKLCLDRKVIIYYETLTLKRRAPAFKIGDNSRQRSHGSQDGSKSPRVDKKSLSPRGESKDKKIKV